MKTAFIAGLAAFANAGVVHEHFAETNLICNLCKDVIGHANSNNEDAIDEVFALFPKLSERMNAFYGSNGIDFTQAERTCQNMNLCEGNESIITLLLEEQPVDLSKHVEHVNNNPKSSWKAAMPKRFEGMSTKEIKRMMGTVVDPDWTVEAEHVKTDVMPGVLPTDFDVSANWPTCAGTVNLSRDQSNCGSCWAHGTTEAFNDRLCISTNGTYTKYLSVADTAGCCNGVKCLSYDCNGGQVATPWRWFKNDGVVSGGPFGQGLYCYDYTMDMCAHHVTSATLGPCDDIV